ncbi:serine O-acetyltransferase [Caulobacter hibisci]|uniref:serine O-acetyltransferase n=1 Tax=Caulobacter hibisci TaxID=2035993 RepID=UPI0018E3B9B7|nr:hypothetical protein [Caulobacter hibisci]
MLNHLPHVVIYALARNPTFNADLDRWAVRAKIELKTLGDRLRFFLRSMREPEFRSLFYYRFPKAKLLRFLAPGSPAFYFYCASTGPGLYIQHGFSTIVVARRIGANFHVNQMVTIGVNGTAYGPTIGDNVTIRVGAIVVGEIEIGDHATIGAGAVITKDVPPNCVVVGNPAVIINRDGVKVNERL